MIGHSQSICLCHCRLRDKQQGLLTVDTINVFMQPFDAVFLPVSGHVKRWLAESATEMMVHHSTLSSMHSSIQRPQYTESDSHRWPVMSTQSPVQIVINRNQSGNSRCLKRRKIAEFSGRQRILHLPITAKAHSKDNSTIAVGLKKSSHRLRLGYFTGDYREHPSSHMIEGLMRSHDRQKTVTLALNIGETDSSDQAARMKLIPDAFVDMRRLSHLSTAQAISNTGVHILFDLHVHLEGKRFGCFNEIPALKTRLDFNF